MEPEDWERLGRTFAAARERISLRQEDVAEAIGVSRTPIQSIERGHTGGKPPSRISGTMRSYARLVGWTDTSIQAVLEGHEPELRPEPTAPQPEQPTESAKSSRLPLRVVDEMESGDLVDTVVIPLGPSASMVIVVTGAPDASPDRIREDASPEKIRAAFEAWQRTQPPMRELSLPQDEPPAAGEE
ncbi:MAG: helix-turn-helix domain-containing protein [Pseudonocardia sp.]